jgi:putative ABC transport system ATP-binding protein
VVQVLDGQRERKAEQDHRDRRDRRCPAGELSGGETARAGLAVALANDPAVVLADEPTGELDSASEARVLDLLQAHAAAGGAVATTTPPAA